MQTQTTDVLTQGKCTQDVQPSLKRWLKHSFYFGNAQKVLSKLDRQKIAQAVLEAEKGHAGEIQVVVEGHIPCKLAYEYTTHCRARQLFAELGVWDTELNSGVLLYINLCEHKVELVFDRGIHQLNQQHTWADICVAITEQIKNNHYCDGIISGIQKIGKVLSQYHAICESVKEKNEIADEPIVL